MNTRTTILCFAAAILAALSLDAYVCLDDGHGIQIVGYVTGQPIRTGSQIVTNTMVGVSAFDGMKLGDLISAAEDHDTLYLYGHDPKQDFTVTATYDTKHELHWYDIGTAKLADSISLDSYKSHYRWDRRSPVVSSVTFHGQPSATAYPNADKDGCRAFENGKPMDTLKLPFPYILGQRFLIQLKSGVTKTVFFDQFGLLREEGGSDSLNIHTNDIAAVLEIPDNLRVPQPASAPVAPPQVTTNVYLTVHKYEEPNPTEPPPTTWLQKFAQNKSGAFYDPKHPLRSIANNYSAEGCWLLGLSIVGFVLKKKWGQIKQKWPKIKRRLLRLYAKLRKHR